MIKALLQSYISGLKNIFKLKWRMSKSDFCRFMTTHFFVCLPWLIAAYFFQNFWFVLLLFIIPYLAMMHRLQDMGKSGFWLFFYAFCIFIVWYVLLVLCSGFAEYFVPKPSLDGEPKPGLVMIGWQLEVIRLASLFSFIPFVFLCSFWAYKWFLPDGEKIANKFGEPCAGDQNKIDKWFLFLNLLFVAFYIGFPFWKKYILDLKFCFGV